MGDECNFDTRRLVQPKSDDDTQKDLCQSNDTQMPEEIWCYQSQTGIDAKGFAVEIGYHGHGTWINFDDSSCEDKGIKYIRADIFEEALLYVPSYFREKHFSDFEEEKDNNV